MRSLLLALCCCLPCGAQAALPRIAILATGGTIAGRGPNTTGSHYVAGAVGVDELITNVPELAAIAQVHGKQVMQVASQSMVPDDWVVLARAVQGTAQDPNVDGVVITHGTDTLEETAFFLNLVLKTRKPIVMVGAMRPASALSADGPFNLYNAVLVAGTPASAGRGVLVLLNDAVHAARDVSKSNTSMTDAFKSTDVGVLGLLQGSHVTFYRTPSRRHTTESAFDVRTLPGALPRVDIVYGYAGAGRSVVDGLVQAGVAGIVYAGVGNGNLGIEATQAVQAARKKDVVVVRSARVGSGLVARNAEIDDEKYDLVTADNLNPQKARVLLMLALTKTHSPRELQQVFAEY